MTTKLDILEIAGATLAAVLFAGLTFLGGENMQTLGLFMAGGVAGAVLGALGAKKFKLMDLGISFGAKVVVHLCVLVMGGLLTLDVAVKTWGDRLDHGGLAAAVGGGLAFFGPTGLMVVIPAVMQWMVYFLWKRIPKAPATEVNSNDSPPRL